MAREHRRWRIAVNSYEPEKGTWRPIVTVSTEPTRADLITMRLLTPAEWVFDTESESDEQGYQLGVAWIDEGT